MAGGGRARILVALGVAVAALLAAVLVVVVTGTSWSPPCPRPRDAGELPREAVGAGRLRVVQGRVLRQSRTGDCAPGVAVVIDQQVLRSSAG
jgi:hypothetical protein